MQGKRSQKRSSRARSLRRLAFESLEDRRVLSGLAEGVLDTSDTVAVSAASTVSQQIVTTSPTSVSANPGQAVSVDVNYTTSTGDATLTGLGLRLHYNSSLLTYKSLTSVLATPVQQQSPASDTGNYDGDSTTDKYVFVSWVDVLGEWPGSIPVKLYTANFTAVASATGSTYVRFSASSTAGSYTFSSSPATISFVTPSTIEGQHLFYNNSTFDGNSAAANSSDDNAIATDKSALLAGQKASFANYSSYSRGINGVMIDFDNLSGTPTASDFEFRVGNSSTPSSWTTLSTSPTVSVRTNVGSGSVDRVTLTWADGTISSTWLQITVLATSRTCLTQSNVFYFGNIPGETGNSLSGGVVEGEDYVTTRAVAKTFTGTAAITNAYDFNRDGTVNASDATVVRGRMRYPASSLKLITPASGTSVVASASATETTAAVASLVADTSTESAANVVTLVGTLTESTEDVVALVDTSTETVVATVDTLTVESESASENSIDPALVTVPVERVDAPAEAEENVATAAAATVAQQEDEETETVTSVAESASTDALRKVAAWVAAERASLSALDSVFEDWADDVVA